MSEKQAPSTMNAAIRAAAGRRKISDQQDASDTGEQTTPTTMNDAIRAAAGKPGKDTPTGEEGKDR